MASGTRETWLIILQAAFDASVAKYETWPETLSLSFLVRVMVIKDNLYFPNHSDLYGYQIPISMFHHSHAELIQRPLTPCLLPLCHEREPERCSNSMVCMGMVCDQCEFLVVLDESGAIRAEELQKLRSSQSVSVVSNES